MYLFRNRFSVVITFGIAVLSPLSTGYTQSSDSLKVTSNVNTSGSIHTSDSILKDSTTQLSAEQPDTAKSSLTDTTSSNLQTNSALANITSNVKQTSTDTVPENDSIFDLKGTWLGLRLGWTIGSYELVNQWQQALPDSLAHFFLNDTSFKMFDSTADTHYYRDTSKIKYLIKELPGIYNISIPVGLLFTRVSENRKTTLLLSFAYIGKTQKSVITGLIDSLSETVNIKQNLRTFSLSLEGNYSLPLPEHYFKVDGVDKSYLTAGVSLSSVIVRISNDIDYGGESNRLGAIRSTVSSVLRDKSAIGAALSFRAGFNTIRALSKKSFVEFGVSYIFSRNDYFYSDNARLNKKWINPGVKDYNKPLGFVTNKIELSVGLSGRIPK